jgi:hypothetical protein
MALLRRKSEYPVAALERELSDVTVRRDQLDAKIGAVAGELAVAVDARRQSLLDSDLSDEVAANRSDAAVRAAQDRHESIRDALSQLGGRIADVQTLLIAARDRVEREQIARDVESALSTLNDARAFFAEAANKLLLMRMQDAVASIEASFGLLLRLTVMPRSIPHFAGRPSVPNCRGLA